MNSVYYILLEPKEAVEMYEMLSEAYMSVKGVKLPDQKHTIVVWYKNYKILISIYYDSNLHYTWQNEKKKKQMIPIETDEFKNDVIIKGKTYLDIMNKLNKYARTSRIVKYK